jgi:uncharacterized membrane protein YczE
MKDAPLLKGNLPVRLVALFVGLILFGFAITFMLESRLGLPPWDVLHSGISKHTSMSLGTAGIVVGLVIVAVTWLAGTPPGFGTLANAVVIGVAINILSSIGAIQRLSGSSLPVRIGLLAAGILLFGVGSALYIGAGMGAGPRDSLMLMLSRRTGKRIAVIRGVMEGTVLVTGILLGGAVGMGTIALAVFVGPVVEASFWLVLRLGLATPRPRRELEFGPLDAA